ncbi:MAG: pyrroline-5-carboxylate reductase [Phycisphaerales bacterium]|jgi:pyrroline-5-carboxylate reductase|nr:pyrroline-5-carboxylate reductase [Phycisphaerales bacterium]
MSITLSVIGGGNMARAIIKGVISAELLSPDNIAVADPEISCRDFYDNLGCLSVTNSSELPKSEVTLLAIKPQIFDKIETSFNSNTVFSIMAGVGTQKIAASIGHSRIVRIMPNLPCSIGYGATGITAGKSAKDEDVSFAKDIFSSIGIVVEVTEDQMDAVTAISGSGPAYLFLLVESMIEGGIKSGLTREAATALAQQTVLGASELLLRDQRGASELREAVTSKGGTTAAALQVMNERKVPKAIEDAIISARDRGRELGN